MSSPRNSVHEKHERHERSCRLVRTLLLFVAFVLFVDRLPAARAEEPFFKKGDVIAIVGGEDMVALSEYGYLELLLTRALPDYRLRFRNLAWEGDTVFAQRRDLGFPTWEEQLEKIGATVVICQFGQMESLAGKEKLPEFIAAYEKLLVRFSGGGKRRIIIFAPLLVAVLRDQESSISDFELSLIRHNEVLIAYERAIELLASRHKFTMMPIMGANDAWRLPQRDNLHFTQQGHLLYARRIEQDFQHDGIIPVPPADPAAVKKHAELKGSELLQEVIRWSQLRDQREKPLLALIIAKNRLWFDYWRVQNWAFLAGDRTNQPSSRDHLDPKKRWFPEERERFLPLIEAREKEIDALAAQLAQP